jgi:hypothetical protein
MRATIYFGSLCGRDPPPAAPAVRESTIVVRSADSTPARTGTGRWPAATFVRDAAAPIVQRRARMCDRFAARWSTRRRDYRYERGKKRRSLR